MSLGLEVTKARVESILRKVTKLRLEVEAGHKEKLRDLLEMSETARRMQDDVFRAAGEVYSPALRCWIAVLK